MKVIDHTLIFICNITKIQNNTYIVITGNSEYSVKLRWSAQRAPVFIDSLSQDRIDELLDRLNIIDVQTVDAAIVNDITED
jgi:hypothetical protein